MRAPTQLVVVTFVPTAQGREAECWPRPADAPDSSGFHPDGVRKAENTPTLPGTAAWCSALGRGAQARAQHPLSVTGQEEIRAHSQKCFCWSPSLLDPWEAKHTRAEP